MITSERPQMNLLWICGISEKQTGDNLSAMPCV